MIGLELRVVTSLALLPKSFVVSFVQAESSVVDGGSIWFGDYHPSDW